MDSPHEPEASNGFMATTKKSSTSKSSAKKSSAKKTSAKNSPAKESASGDGQACWPGFQRKPGTRAGAKGSCEPKAHQTAGEKQADSKAAAARKREKGQA